MTRILGLCDPGVVAAPTAQTATEWLTRLARWSSFTRDYPISPILSESGRDAALACSSDFPALAAALAGAASPLSTADVITLLGNFLARCPGADECLQPSEVVFRRLAVSPEYSRIATPVEKRGVFHLELGHFAVAVGRHGEIGGVLTAAGSWADDESEALIEGDVEMAVTHSILEQYDEAVWTFDEQIPLWATDTDVDSVFHDRFNRFVGFARAGVEVAYRKVTPEQQRAGNPLEVVLLDSFDVSLHGLGYSAHKKRGRAAAAFRAAALIGSGRQSHTSLNSHPYHLGTGGGGRPIRKDGDLLYRGYLANNSANAPRIYWWDTRPIEIIAVTGHDDPPPI